MSNARTMAQAGERLRHILRRADVAINKTCKRAGLRPIGWHVLRQTFASHLATRGRPVKEIQELLGHSDIGQTMRYAHLMPSIKRDAWRRWTRRRRVVATHMATPGHLIGNRAQIGANRNGVDGTRMPAGGCRDVVLPRRLVRGLATMGPIAPGGR